MEPTGGFYPVVPAKAMKILKKLLADEYGTILFSFTQNEFTATGFNFKLYSRLLVGRFPAWRQVLPNKRDQKTTVTVKAGTLREKLSPVMAVFDEDDPALTFTFSKAGFLHLHNKKFTERLWLENFSGKSRKIKFNPTFFLDFLGSLSSETDVTIELANPTQCEAENLTYIIVPLGI